MPDSVFLISQREMEWKSISYPKALMRFYSLSNRRRPSHGFTATLSLTNRRLSPHKAMLYEIKSWHGCQRIIFFPSCNVYFMFALVHSDAKKISTLTILTEVCGALVNSFNAFPCVVNSSFHIFPGSSSLCLGSEWTCQETCPHPYPCLWPSFAEAQLHTGMPSHPASTPHKPCALPPKEAGEKWWFLL